MFTISYILSLSQTSSKCYYKSIINEIEEAFNKKNIPFDRNNMDYLSESYIEEYLRPIVGDKIADKLLKERFSLLCAF